MIKAEPSKQEFHFNLCELLNKEEILTAASSAENECYHCCSVKSDGFINNIKQLRWLETINSITQFNFNQIFIITIVNLKFQCEMKNNLPNATDCHL